MNIVSICSEMTPLAKTGGLADVAAALPRALAARGHHVSVIMPLYTDPARAPHPLELVLPDLFVELPAGPRRMRVHRLRESAASRSGGGSLEIYLIEDPFLFDRPQLYAEGGQEYPDNPLRFAYFCLAALWATKGLALRPDIFHCHDWQAALVPIYLRRHPAVSRDPELTAASTLFSIHNLSYQGVCPHSSPLSSDWTPVSPDTQDRWSFTASFRLLKGALVHSDWLATVSPTYAREIQTPEFGCGLDGEIRRRSDRLTGILNGIGRFRSGIPRPTGPCRQNTHGATWPGRPVARPRSSAVLACPSAPECP